MKVTYKFSATIIKREFIIREETDKYLTVEKSSLGAGVAER